MTPRGLALVKEFEGCKLVAYQDMVGVWTIGYGHTLAVKRGDTITQERADEMLLDELRVFELRVLALCLGKTNLNQLDALTALAYNIGLSALAGSTVLRKHNAGDRLGAADAFLLWNRAGGRPVSGLTRRRAAERLVYLSAAS